MKKLTLPPQYLALLILPVLVLVTSEGLLSAFGDPDVDLGELAFVAVPELAELAGRYRFLAIFFFYGACCVTVIALFAMDLAAHQSLRSIGLAGLGFVGLVGFSILFSILEPAWMGSFEAYALLGATLFEEGLRGGSAQICGVDLCDGKGAFYVMKFLLDQTNWMSALAVSAVVLGMVWSLSTSGKPDLKSAEGIAAEGAWIEAAQKRMRRYLYLAGLLLSVGMMMGFAWMKWPTGLLADVQQKAQFESLVDAVALFRGSSYSVLILSFYMPVSLVLAQRIERYEAARVTGKTKDVAPKFEGFDIERIGTLDSFKAIVSILAPVLASAVGTFIDPGLLG